MRFIAALTEHDLHNIVIQRLMSDPQFEDIPERPALQGPNLTPHFCHALNAAEVEPVLDPGQSWMLVISSAVHNGLMANTDLAGIGIDPNIYIHNQTRYVLRDGQFPVIVRGNAPSDNDSLEKLQRYFPEINIDGRLPAPHLMRAAGNLLYQKAAILRQGEARYVPEDLLAAVI